MLRSLKLKPVYRSEDDSLLEDFYLPALSVANAYDRAVGYFSATMLSYAAQGLTAFIGNNGKMRLIFGGEIDEEDEKAISDGYRTRELSERLGLKMLDTMERFDDALTYRRLETLAWLVACGRLDIKVALRRKGMYHEKIGILRDADGDAVVFQGSANETTSALLPDFNFESINVFPCWQQELTGHFTPYLDGFERLWKDEAKNTIVLDFPDAARQKLIKIAKNCQIPTPEIEIDLIRRQNRANSPEESNETLNPSIPKFLNGRAFAMHEHQLKALASWKAHQFRGIFALATGSGKTITAIYGAVKVFQSTKRMVLGIAVPYQNLADQWLATLLEFNIVAVACYGGRDRWHERLAKLCYLYQSDAVHFICFVVVNRTLQSADFQNILQQFPGGNLMWIGDECHHHGTTNLAAALPVKAEMRIGLSATPEHYLDANATQRLKDYYGDIVAEFTLADALEAKVITPYKYYICPVELTEDEATEYREISQRISLLAGRLNSGDIESSGDEQIKILLAQRARILGTAREKLRVLQALLQSMPPAPFSLFYCGDGSVEDDVTGEVNTHCEQVSELLHRNGWKCSHFTSRESREARSGLLDQFRYGSIDALVAIRCLDEGIDVPACRTAFLLASARNPKQFIQRRGRILRKAEGKEFAVIYDFLVKLPEGPAGQDTHERQLIQAELKRVAEFSQLALNSAETVQTLLPILQRYDLAHVLS